MRKFAYLLTLSLMASVFFTGCEKDGDDGISIGVTINGRVFPITTVSQSKVAGGYDLRFGFGTGGNAMIHINSSSPAPLIRTGVYKSLTGTLTLPTELGGGPAVFDGTTMEIDVKYDSDNDYYNILLKGTLVSGDKVFIKYTGGLPSPS